MKLYFAGGQGSIFTQPFSHRLLSYHYIKTNGRGQRAEFLQIVERKQHGSKAR